MSPPDFLKSTMGDAHVYSLGEHVQEGPVLLIFVVLLQLMAIKIYCNFRTS